MNFLLHHHLAARDLASPLAAVGAMLPDLWRMADRRVHALPLAGAEAALSRKETEPTAQAVLRGVHHHVVADAWFHADAVFRDGERATAAALRQAAPDAPRIGLFAHALWEICLDGALVRRVGHAELHARLQRDLKAARDAHGALSRAVTVHHFDRVVRDAGARAAFTARMTKLEDALAAGLWTAGYAHGAGVVERLDGMRARFGFPAIAAASRGALADAIDATIARAAAPVDAILARAPFTPAPSPPSYRAC